MFLNDVVFSKDVRTFKKGDRIDFTNQLTIITGDNGIGKSTLVGSIRNLYENKWTLSHDNQFVDVLENDVDKSISIGYLDLSSDLLANSPEINFDNFALQKKCMHSSSGEGAVYQLVDFLEKNKDKPLIIIDEPERGLSILKQRRIAEAIQKHLENNEQQILLTTHSQYIMSLSKSVFSMNHFSYVSPVDYLRFMLES